MYRKGECTMKYRKIMHNEQNENMNTEISRASGLKNK